MNIYASRVILCNQNLACNLSWFETCNIIFVSKIFVSPKSVCNISFPSWCYILMSKNSFFWNIENFHKMLTKKSYCEPLFICESYIRKRSNNLYSYRKLIHISSSFPRRSTCMPENLSWVTEFVYVSVCVYKEMCRNLSSCFTEKSSYISVDCIISCSSMMKDNIFTSIFNSLCEVSLSRCEVCFYWKHN